MEPLAPQPDESPSATRRAFWRLRITVFVTIGLLVGFAAWLVEQRADEQEARRKKAEQQTLFTDASGGYALRYPGDWSLADHSAKDEMIRADISRDTGLGLQVRLMPMDGGTLAGFVDAYIKQFTTDMRGHYRQAQLSSGDRLFTTLGPNPCFTVTFYHRRGGRDNWLLKSYLFATGGKALVLQSGTRLAAAEANEPILDAIAASVRFRRK